MTSGRVQSPADLFSLSVQELLGFERMGEVLAQKFVDALENASATRPPCKGLSVRLAYARADGPHAGSRVLPIWTSWKTPR